MKLRLLFVLQAKKIFKANTVIFGKQMTLVNGNTVNCWHEKKTLHEIAEILVHKLSTKRY